jgi:hypothetical protein
MAATIQRRLLVNYRVDPAVLSTARSFPSRSGPSSSMGSVSQGSA